MKRSTLERYVNALKTAERLRIDLTQNFHALPASEVDKVLHAADLHNYSKPRGANGSRGRYFYAYLQKAAKPRELSGFTDSALFIEHASLVRRAAKNWGPPYA